MVGITLIGLFAQKKVRTSKDFSVAGQGLPTMTIAGTCIASAIGANVVIGKYDLILESGMSGIAVTWFWWFGWLCLLLMGKRLRKSGASSIPDFMQKRYGEHTRKLGAVCVLLSTISITGAQFLAIAQILEALNFCSHETGIWVGAAIIVLLTVFSGLWGVAITDTVQAVFLLIAFGLVFPIMVFHTAGGWDTVMASYTAQELSPFQNLAPLSIVGWFVYYAFSAGADPVFAQRIFAAKDAKCAIRGQLIAWSVTLIVCGLVSAVPALAIKQIFPDLTVGSQFTPMFLVAYMPPIIRGLMLSFLLSIMITTGDSQLLALTSNIVDDMVEPHLKERQKRHLLLLNRLVCVCAAILVCVVTQRFSTIYSLLKTGGSAYGAGLFIPLLLGCYWKKAASGPINLGMIVGTVVSFAFDFLVKPATHTSLDGVIPGGILCLLICVVGSLAHQKRTMHAN